MLLGLFLIIGGVLSLANPFAASVAVTTLVGIFFLVSGVLGLWFVFRDATQQHRVWNGIVAAMGLIAGVFLLANPLKGMVSLTLILGILFLITGVARLIMAFRLRETQFFWLLLLSGGASALIGILVFSNFAAAAATLLGLLLGIELLAEGVALVALGLIARSFR